MKLNHSKFVELRNSALNGTNREKQIAYKSLYDSIYSTINFVVGKQCLKMKGEEKQSMVQLVLSHILNEKTLNAFDVTKNPEPWVKCIAKNKCIDEYKKHAEEEAKLSIDSFYTNDDDDSSASFEPKDDVRLADDKMQWESIKYLLHSKAMQVLTGDQQKVLVLFYFKQKNQQEIMEELNISKNNVGVQLNRALNKLREYFDSRPGYNWLML